MATLLVAATAETASVPEDLLRLPVRSTDGAAVPLGTVLGGAYAVVTLWATYCPPCRAEVPVFARAARRWSGRGVRVLGVALDFDRPARVTRAVREWGIAYDTFWVSADQQDAADALIPAGLPSTFFVGPDGVSRYDRALSDADLDALIAKHLRPAASPGAGQP